MIIKNNREFQRETKRVILRKDFLNQSALKYHENFNNKKRKQ